MNDVTRILSETESRDRCEWCGDRVTEAILGLTGVRRRAFIV